MKNKPVQEDIDELLNELCESYIAKGFNNLKSEQNNPLNRK
ncbi:hypothetical protein [Bacillus toyonensis]|nr:hypothetical protein [Bacillus toyonensis]